MLVGMICGLHMSTDSYNDAGLPSPWPPVCCAPPGTLDSSCTDRAANAQSQVGLIHPRKPFLLQVWLIYSSLKTPPGKQPPEEDFLVKLPCPSLTPRIKSPLGFLTPSMHLNNNGGPLSKSVNFIIYFISLNVFPNRYIMHG